MIAICHYHSIELSNALARVGTDIYTHTPIHTAATVNACTPRGFIMLLYMHTITHSVSKQHGED